MALITGITPEHADDTDDVLTSEGQYLAELYEKLEDDHDHPAVIDSYQRLIGLVHRQYQQILDTRVMIVPSAVPTPSSQDLFSSISDGVLPVLMDDDVTAPHPLFSVNHFGVTDNVAFRAVHDIFGHYRSRSNFSDRGERTALLSHSRTVDDPGAMMALITETRLQNAWTNHLPAHRHLSPKDRPFPVQKSPLFSKESLPDTLITALESNIGADT